MIDLSTNSMVITTPVQTRFLLALLLQFFMLLTPACTTPNPDIRTPDALQLSLQELADSLTALENDVRQSPSFGSEAEQVGGYRHLLRALAKGMEAGVLQDPDFPYFRILDFWLKEGGDNPDQRYAFSPVRGGETYRIWGELGSAARIEFQLYAGRPWDGSGKSLGYLTFEELALKPDGSFEVWLSQDQQGDNWLANPTDASTVFVRHIYDQWGNEQTGDVHIDRVGFEGSRPVAETREELAAKIREMTAMFSATVRTWPETVDRRFINRLPVNTVSTPYDTYALGGALGRWMSAGHFSLQPDQALLIRMPATGADYQAIQLTDMWFASMEHGNQVSSLNTAQSILSPDGNYYFVISQRDPGHANWLDTGTLERGTILMRWDGMSDKLETTQNPTATLMPLNQIAAAIPGFKEVSEEQRQQVRAERRRHLQLRSHR